MLNKYIITILSLFFAQTAFCELDWNITGSGARAAGMGNAFIGVADDATAVNWNPGGLTILEHFEASFVGGASLYNIDYEPSDNIEGDDYENYAYSYDNSHPGIVFGSMAYPFRIMDKKIVTAIAYQKLLDFYDDYEFSYDLGTYIQNYEGSSDGGVSALTFGAAYQIIPSLSFGACLNYWMGSFNRETLTSNDTEWSYTESEFKNFKGFNMIAGILFDFSSIKENVPLKFGAVVKTPFQLEYDLNYYTEDSSLNTSESIYTGKVDIPTMFGIGVSYRFGDFFTVSADFESRLYGDAQESQFDENGEHVSWSPSYLSDSRNDLNQIRIGMEYLVVTDNLIIPLRLGAFTFPTLRADVENDMDDSSGSWEKIQTSSEQSTGFGISLGSGIIFEKFALDISYTYLNYEYENINNYPSGNSFSDKFVVSKNSMNFSAIVYIDSFIK